MYVPHRILLCACLAWLGAQPARAGEARAVWADATPHAVVLRFARQGDRGWEPPLTVRSQGLNITPSLCVDARDRTWIAWIDREESPYALRVARIEGGEIAALPRVPVGRALAFAPDILAEDGGERIWVAWSAEQDGDEDIQTAYFQNGTWSQPLQAHRDNARPDILPRLDKHGGGIRVRWSCFNGQGYDTCAATWTGRGWREEAAVAGTAARRNGAVPVALPPAAAGRIMGALSSGAGAARFSDQDGRLPTERAGP